MTWTLNGEVISIYDTLMLDNTLRFQENSSWSIQPSIWDVCLNIHKIFRRFFFNLLKCAYSMCMYICHFISTFFSSLNTCFLYYSSFFHANFSPFIPTKTSIFHYNRFYSFISIFLLFMYFKYGGGAFFPSKCWFIWPTLSIVSYVHRFFRYQVSFEPRYSWAPWKAWERKKASEKLNFCAVKLHCNIIFRVWLVFFSLCISVGKRKPPLARQ